MEFCTGMQENEKELEDFLRENPNFPNKNPLDIDFIPDEGER